MLINCQVKAIYFAEQYPDDLANDMLKEAGVEHAYLPGDYRSS